MSNKVDERITRIRFDNDQFEKGVATSLQSIDRLKNKLESTESVHAFEGIQRSADKTDLSGIAKAVDNISDKFSVLHHVVIDVLADITKKAIEAGANLAKSLSVDDMLAGWQKYDQEIQAVQTIMVTLDDTPIEEVEKALEKVGWFSDETSYSYEQMVTSMSKFISSGASLDAATDAVLGVANAAAAAGVSTKNAERAFYNFSQAMGVGYMQLLDWRSIENLSMATPEFKRNILETAAALGKIVKIGDDLYKMEGETDPDNFFTSISMAQSLHNKWFDKDVILEVSKLYSGFANQVYEVQNAMDFDNANETIEFLKKSGQAIDDISQKAFLAGQEAKTFSEAVSSVKDALGTKWKDTFKEIFGNYEDATKLWTKFANELYALVATSSDTRNEILEQWNDPATFLLPEARLAEMFQFPELKTGREVLLEGLWNIYYSIVNVVDTIKSAWNQVFPEMTAKRLYFMTRRFRDFSKRILEFTENLEGVEKFLTGIFKGIKNSYNTLWPVVQKSWGYLKSVFQDIWSFFKGAWEYLKPTDIFEGLINTVDGLWNLWQSFSRVGSVIIEAWKEVFPDISNWFIVITTKFKEITELILGTTDDMSGFQSFLTGIFKVLRVLWGILKKIFNFFEGLLPVLQKVWEIVKSIGSQVWQFLKDAWDYLKGSETFSGIINRIESDLKTLKETLLGFDASTIKLPTFEDFLNALNDVTTLAGKFGKLIGSAFEWIRKKFKKFLPAKAIEDVAEATDNVAESAVLVLELFNSDEMAETRAQIKETGETFSTVFTWINNNVGGALKWLKEKLQNFDLKDMLATGFLGVFSWFTIKMGTATANVLESFDVLSEALATGVKSVLTSIGGIFGGFGSLVKAYTRNVKAQTIGEIIGYIRSIAIAILAIVSAIYIFNKIEDPEENIKKTIKTIGLLGAGLIAIVVILAFVSNKLNTYSKGVNTNFSIFNARGITVTGPKSSGILSLVLGILGLVMAFKWMYEIFKESDLSARQAYGIADIIIHMSYALTVCIIAMQAVSAILNKYVGAKVTISSFGPLALATSLLVMVRAFKKIQELDLDSVEFTIVQVLEILGFLTAIGAVLKIIDAGTGIGLLGISLAILAFIGALKWLSKEKIDLSQNAGLVAILVGIIFVLGLISAIFNKGQILNKDQKLRRVQTSMISVVIAMAAFVAATAILGKMDREQLIQGAIAALVAMITLMGLIIIMVGVAGKAGQYAGKGMLGLSLLIAFVTIAFVLISFVTYLNREHYDKVLATMIVLFGGIATMLIPLSLFSGKISAGIVTLSMMIIAVGLLLAELYYIDKNDPSRLQRVVWSVIALLAALGVMAFAVSNMNAANAIVNSYHILEFVGLLLLELGVVVFLLSHLVKDNPALLKAAGAMAIIAIAVGAVTALLGALNIGNTGAAIKAAAAFAIVAGVLGGVVIALSQWVNGENLSFLKTYGNELLVLTGVLTLLTYALSVLGLIGPHLLLGALIGAGALAIVVLAITGLLALLYWMFKNIDVQEISKNLDGLSEVTFRIGQVFGSFFDGLTAGKNRSKIEDTTDSVEALTPLAEAMIPLSNAFSDLPTDFDAKAIAFKNGIKELKGVSGEFKNVTTFTDMLTALDELAPKFRDIAAKVTESDFGNLANLEGAVENILTINTMVYGISDKEVLAVIEKLTPILNNLASIPVYNAPKAIRNSHIIVQVLGPLGDLIDTFGEIGIHDDNDIFTGNYITGFNRVMDAIKEMAPNVPIDDFASYSTADLESAEKNSKKLSAFLISFGDVIKAFPRAGGLAQLLAGSKTNTFDKLPEFSDAVIRYGRQLMATENIQPVNSAIGVTTDLATAFQMFMGQDMPSKLHSVAVAIGELVTAGVDKVATFFTDNRAISAVSDAIGNLVENFRTEINAEIKNNRIVEYMQMLYSTILDNVRYQALNFYLSGKLLHDEFIRGLKGEVFDAEAAGIELGKGAQTGTSDIMQIKSPSKVMFGLGEDSGIGYALGIISTIDAVESASESIGEAAMRGTASGMRNFMNSKQYAKTMGNALTDRRMTKIYENSVGDKIASFFGGVLGVNGEEVSPEQLWNEFVVEPFQNKKGQFMSVLGDMTLEDIKDGSWKNKVGDVFSDTLLGSMDRAVVSSAVGETITNEMLNQIAKATGLTNVQEVLAETFTPDPEEDWFDKFIDPDNVFDWDTWFQDWTDSYLNLSETVSDNPIESIFTDGTIPTSLPSSYDYQSLARSATGGGTVAGYTAEDVRALTTEIHGLEDALYSLKETMKDQHMVHSGEIRVKYTNESDFIDRIQTTIITSLRREARS